MVLLKPNSTTDPSPGLQKAFSGPTRSTRHLLCPRLCLQGQSDTVPGSVHPGLGVAFTAQLSLFPQFSTEGPETTHVQSMLCKREVKLPGEASASLGKPCDKMLPCRHTHPHTHPHRVFLISDSFTRFSESVRNPSSAASKNSTMGLSCVTLWISSSLCPSKRAVSVSASSVVSRGKRIQKHKRRNKSV